MNTIAVLQRHLGQMCGQPDERPKAQVGHLRRWNALPGTQSIWIDFKGRENLNKL